MVTGYFVSETFNEICKTEGDESMANQKMYLGAPFSGFNTHNNRVIMIGNTVYLVQKNIIINNI